MFTWIFKLDSIVLVLLFTIIAGGGVIALRSKTYSVGYEIAKLKSQEQKLREQNTELRIQLYQAQKRIRERLLAEKTMDGKKKFVFPDNTHVIIEKHKNAKRN